MRTPKAARSRRGTTWPALDYPIKLGRRWVGYQMCCGLWPARSQPSTSAAVLAAEAARGWLPVDARRQNRMSAQFTFVALRCADRLTQSWGRSSLVLAGRNERPKHLTTRAPMAAIETNVPAVRRHRCHERLAVNNAARPIIGQ